MNRTFTSALLGLALLASTRAIHATENDVHPGRVRARVLRAVEVEEERPLAPAPTVETPAPTPAKPSAPYRAAAGRGVLYAPTFFHPNAETGTYDVIVHFHGMCGVQEQNVEALGLNAVVVSVNVGIGSGPYEDAFRDPKAFDALLAATSAAMARSGRAPGATIGRIALSAWSAGYGAVSALLRDPTTAARIDAVLLADGLHAGLASDGAHGGRAGRVVEERSLAKYERLAEAAFRGDKLFAMTHSAIPTGDYASSTETTTTLLAMAHVAKDAPSDGRASDGPRGMKEVYESHRGDFHAFGFEGTTAKDHIDHIRAMGETLYPYLKARWTR